MESIPDGETGYAKTLNQQESLHSPGAEEHSGGEMQSQDAYQLWERFYFIFVLRAYGTIDTF